MDRSFLSDAEVIAASRGVICVRLLTYEDAEEQRLMRTFLIGRSGDVENTTVCLLSPDGSKVLSRAGRSARQLFRDAPTMARELQEVAKKYPAKASPESLPVVADVRLALDVASADNQPLAVIVADSDAERKQLRERLAKLAWSEPFIGRMVYASAATSELTMITGSKPKTGIVIIAPDQFGQKGTVLASATSEQSSKEWESTLADSLKQFKPMSKTFQNHVREGHRQGIFWETKLPVTDPEEQSARERGKKNAPKK